MKNLLSNNSTPLYQQVYNLLKDKVNSGEYSPGDQLPSEPELAKSFGVSRITLRTAIDKLVEGGYLNRHRGKGTYVSETAMMDSISARGSFTISCKKQNAVPNTHIISAALGRPGEKAADRLCIHKEDEVLIIERLRLINKKPAIFEIDYLPKDRFRDLLEVDLEDQSLFSILREKYQIVPDMFYDEFSVRSSGITLSNYLDCPTSTALLWVGQRVCCNEQVVYYNEQYIRSERYGYTVKTRISE